jgi:LysM repeat protein/serine/threonine protein phosphatase PrpC
MNHKTSTSQYHLKSHNEDFAYDWLTSKGHLFVVLDFASFSYTTLQLTLQRSVKEVIEELDTVPGLSIESFLGEVAKELNNFVFTYGRDNFDSKLFCVAAIALINGNTLYYLTYGDSRINIFTGDRLLLLNGAKYQTRSVITDTKDAPPPIRENPEQMGRSLFDMPLTDRVRKFALSDDDVILMYSDGLEENVTPQRRLSELRTLGKTDPKTLGEAMIKIADAQDDRTIIVIEGPYQPLGESLAVQVNTALQAIEKRLVDLESTSQSQSQVTTQLKTQLSSQNNSGDVAALEARIAKLETRNGKVKGRAADGPVVFTLDQSTYDKIREIVNAKGGSQPKQAEVADASGLSNVIENKVYKKPEPEGFSKWLVHPIVATVSVFLFGMLALWVLQSLSNKLWPERWTARTEGETLIVQREDYVGSGPAFSVKLQPPVVSGTTHASSFEELAPFIAKLQVGTTPQPVQSSTNRNDNTAVPPTDTVVPVPVLAGDSLSKIASRYKISDQKLKELNPGITNWDKIQKGDQVQVPANANNRNP